MLFLQLINMAASSSFESFAVVFLRLVPGAALALSLAGPARAERRIADDPLAGTVVDETVTVAGHEFFQAFIAAWRESDGSERHSLRIVERASARFGSQLWIESAQRRVFQAAVPASREARRTLAEDTAGWVARQAAEADVERLLFRDPDLGHDEL
ncbi:hypothetical protein E4K72_06590 [Oxalobacteraceae bacterium OM1]|nr:hypothetical protein E4K72_06590 [Oxalobacteraceae bacterium OM1]